VALTADQARKLREVYVEERARVPQPAYEDSAGTSDKYVQAMNDWEEDYNKRVSDAAAGILNSQQLTTYNDVQQWQKEMRNGITLPPGAGPEVPQAHQQLRLAEQLGGALAAGDVRARRSGGMDADQRALGRERQGRRRAGRRARPTAEPGPYVDAGLSLAAAVVKDQRDAALVAQAIDGLLAAVGRKRRR